jgi:formiminoglutamase
VVVGGGHDHGFSHLKGLTEARPVRWGCINIDAHLDVRRPEPHPTSGSPFYLCLEDGVLLPEDLVEFGIQSHCNGPALWEYVRAKGVRVVHLSELRAPGEALRRFESELSVLAERVDAIAISLDLDALAQAHCPGVSAPQAEGLSSSDVMAMLESAGRHPKVASLGIFELNPAHDIGDATARIAATGAHHFIQASLEAAEAEAAGEAGLSS